MEEALEEEEVSEESEEDDEAALDFLETSILDLEDDEAMCLVTISLRAKAGVAF